MLTNAFLGLLRHRLTDYFGGTIDEEQKEILSLYGEDIIQEAKKQGLKV